jgi:putative ABC transport system permease protein
MLKNYLAVACRSIKRNKLYSFINIAGLTVGITSCILIGLYVFNQLSYDNFHKNADRIVRVTMEYNAGGTVTKTAVTGTKAGPQLKRILPGVEAFVRTIKAKKVIGYGESIFNEANVLYADSAFLKTFSFNLVYGNERTALNSPDNIVITRSIAKKYFGNEDVIGKTLRVGDAKDFVVSGVAEDVPGNSRLNLSSLYLLQTWALPKEKRSGGRLIM